MYKRQELLFPHITKNPEDYEAQFPKRDLKEGAMVTRLGPSPTGFIHLGNLYGAFVDERLAHQSGGTFYLRIEDTDDKRYVEGAVETIINSCLLYTSVLAFIFPLLTYFGVQGSFWTFINSINYVWSFVIGFVVYILLMKTSLAGNSHITEEEHEALTERA